MKSLRDKKCLDEIFQRIDRLRPDSVRQWGEMTAAEMVRHVSEAFRVGLGERTAAAPSNLLTRTVLKWIVLYAPMTWPKNVKGPPGKDTRPVSEREPFPEAVAALKQITSRFVLSKKQNAMLPHPFFGPLTDAQWNRWGYLHCDHHLRQFGV